MFFFAHVAAEAEVAKIAGAARISVIASMVAGSQSRCRLLEPK
jgi:hypothetical protein